MSTKSPSPNTFSDLLRFYRNRTVDPLDGRKSLTQERFAECLELETGFIYSYGTISAWERGVASIDHLDRALLVGVIKLLHKYDGLHNPQEADRLLSIGGYRQLSEDEKDQINPQWRKPISVKSKELPPPVPYFVNRENEVQQLTNAVNSFYGVPLFFVVGRAGIGKTSFTRQFLIHYQLEAQKNPTEIIWLGLGALSQTSATDFFQSTVTLLGERIFENNLNRSSLDHSIAQLKGYLRTNQPIVVLDGIESIPHIESLLSFFPDIAAGARFIITTRVAPSHFENAYACYLNDLSIDDTQHLLIQKAEGAGLQLNTVLKKETVQEIYESLGGHPLTLVSLTKLLRLHPVSALLTKVKQGGIGDLHQIYNAIWEHLSSLAKVVLRTLCFVSEAGVDLNFLQLLLNEELDDIEVAVQDLDIHSLLHVAGGLDRAPSYHIHNLTKQYLLDSFPSDLPHSASIVLQHLYQDAVKSGAIDSKSLEACQFRLLAAFNFSYRLIDTQINDLRSKLLIELFPLIEYHALLHHWLSIFAKQIKLISDTKTSCTLIRQHAVIQQHLNNHEVALDLLNKAEELANAYKLETELANILFSKALSLNYQRKYNSAHTLALTALEQFQQCGFKDAETIAAQNLLGLISFQFGELEVAQNYFQNVANIAKENNLMHHFTPAVRNIGRIYVQKGNYKKASETYTLGYKTLDTSSARLHIIQLQLSQSLSYILQAEYKAAKKILDQVDTGYLERNKAFRQLAAVLSNQGYLLLMEEQYDQAAEKINEAILLWEQIGDVYERANAIDTLGDIWAGKEKQTLAIEEYEKALLGLRDFDDYEVDILRTKLLTKIKKRGDSV